MVSLNLCPVSISSIGVHLLKDIVLINILTNSMLKVTVMSLLTVSNTVLSLKCHLLLMSNDHVSSQPSYEDRLILLMWKERSPASHHCMLPTTMNPFNLWVECIFISCRIIGMMMKRKKRRKRSQVR